MEFIRANQLDQWVIATISWVAVLVVLLLFRKWAGKRLSKWAAATPSEMDNQLLNRLDKPVKYLLFVVALGVAARMGPQAFASHPIVVYGTKILFVVVGIWIIERIITAVFETSQFMLKLSGGTRSLILTIARIMVMAIGFMMVLDTVGISITPFLASLGLGSVAVALALQDTLGNFFSGIYIIVDKPIELGQFVKINEDVEGTVVKIGWRSTQVKLLSNNTVIIPNTKIAASQITNFEFPEPELGLTVAMGVAYGSDLEKVEKVVIDVGKKIMTSVPGAVANHTPTVRFHTFSSSSIDFNVGLKAKQYSDSFLVKHEFIKAVHARFENEKISIPFPQMDVHVQKNLS